MAGTEDEKGRGRTSVTPDYRGKRDCNNPWGALGLNLGLEPAQAAPGT